MKLHLQSSNDLEKVKKAIDASAPAFHRAGQVEAQPAPKLKDNFQQR